MSMFKRCIFEMFDTETGERLYVSSKIQQFSLPPVDDGFINSCINVIKSFVRGIRQGRYLSLTITIKNSLVKEQNLDLDVY